MSAPLIAVVAYRLSPGQVNRWKEIAWFAAPESYVEAVRRSGGRPVLLPPGDKSPPEEILSRFDGLMLIGGGDIDPARYGGDPDAPVYAVEPERDQLEIELTIAAAAAGVPTLAICRGAQVVNVAFGGTLIQHLPDLTGLVPHGSPLDGGPVQHDVRLVASSIVGKAAGVERLSCTSHHHQGIGEIGGGLVATAWADDGQVEALEAPDGPGWLLAVVWHPEATAATDARQRAIFDEFIRQASAH